MDNQDHASLQSALVQSCLALSSDPDMLDYMAAITAEELSSFDAANKQSRSAAVAALQEALGIFLLVRCRRRLRSYFDRSILMLQCSWSLRIRRDLQGFGVFVCISHVGACVRLKL